MEERRISKDTEAGSGKGKDTDARRRKGKCLESRRGKGKGKGKERELRNGKRKKGDAGRQRREAWDLTTPLDAAVFLYDFDSRCILTSSCVVNVMLDLFFNTK